MSTLTEWLTAAEAAEIADRHPESIARACRRGTLRGVKRGNQWFIHRDALDTYLANPPKPGPDKGQFFGRRPHEEE